MVNILKDRIFLSIKNLKSFCQEITIITVTVTVTITITVIITVTITVIITVTITVIILRMKKYILTVFAVEIMRSNLITILLSSEKRTDLLLLLKEKPRTVEEINNELDTNSVAILPQLKKLKENGIVIQEKKIYELSLLGKIIVRKMESLVKALRQLENDYK